MKKGLQRTLALALGLCTLTVPASAAASTSFTDVSSTYWGYSYISEAASKGLVSGIGNRQYGPELALTQTQFVTMVCNMFYANAVAAQSSSGDWWLPYMNVARGAGLLANTTIVQQYSSTSGWNSSVNETSITRYDMAQILANVATAQSWESPDALTLMYARLLIEDWDSIPSQYRNAVASSYARGFLTGDDQGYFNGDSSTTRAQAAVVLCALDESRTTITTPTYTNTTWLTNGLSATEENVSDLLDGLRNTYPNYGTWNMDRSYTSRVLGTGTGSRAFVYMLSDQVFGAMRSTRLSDPEDLRVGDVITLSGGQYGLVASVDGASFTYVTCNSSGVITWGNTMTLRSLSSSNTVYTRYSSLPRGEDTLANGLEATTGNVEDLIDDLMRDDDYEQDVRWRDEYDSEVFGTADGDEGFAYLISDEIFGDLEATRVTRISDMRVGDLVWVTATDEDNQEYSRYGVVVDINRSRETFVYVSLDESNRIDWDCDGDFDDVERLYTRYPEEEQADDELTNGESVTTGHVRSLLETVLDRDYDDYYEDRVWLDDEEYTDSDVFPDADGSQGFAYFISDKIFGKLPDRDVERARDLRVGDVIYDEDEGLFGIVDIIDTQERECTYYSIDRYGELDQFTCDFGAITDMFTRYLDDDSDSLDEDDVENILWSLEDDDEFGDGKEWDIDNYDDSNALEEADGFEESFAFALSDEIFGNDPADTHHDADDVMAGDIIYADDYDHVYVVLEVHRNRNDEYVECIGLEDDGNEWWIEWDNIEVDFSNIDEIITRY